MDTGWLGEGGRGAGWGLLQPVTEMALETILLRDLRPQPLLQPPGRRAAPSTTLQPATIPPPRPPHSAVSVLTSSGRPGAASGPGCSPPAPSCYVCKAEGRAALDARLMITALQSSPRGPALTAPRLRSRGCGTVAPWHFSKCKPRFWRLATPHQPSTLTSNPKGNCRSNSPIKTRPQEDSHSLCLGEKQIPIKRKVAERESPKPWPGAREGREGRSRMQGGAQAPSPRSRTMWRAGRGTSRGSKERARSGETGKRGNGAAGAAVHRAPSGDAKSPPFH